MRCKYSTCLIYCVHIANNDPWASTTCTTEYGSGTRCAVDTPTNCGVRYNVICALGPTKGLIEFSIVTGAMKADHGIAFLKLLTEIGVQSVILDNAVIYQGKCVRQSHDIPSLTFLPPYSPDFALIEFFFGTFRAKVPQTLPFQLSSNIGNYDAGRGRSAFELGVHFQALLGSLQIYKNWFRCSLSEGRQARTTAIIGVNQTIFGSAGGGCPRIITFACRNNIRPFRFFVTSEYFVNERKLLPGFVFLNRHPYVAVSVSGL